MAPEHKEVGRSLVGADMRNEDLRHSDLTEQILFGTDFRGSNLYGAKVSLKCQTFDGAKFDSESVAKLLLMISLADIDPKWQVGLRDLVRRVTGEQFFAALQRYLQIA